MRPFFCYYGGKWTWSKHCAKPEHETIVEPFAGGAGYATQFAERSVILVERDPLIAALWRYLIAVRSSEIRALPLMLMDQTVDDLSVCEEARNLIGFWLNKGVEHPRRSPSAWMRQGLKPNCFWGEFIRERIASQVDGIKHWRLIEGDYTQAPDIEATWFIDPPYQRMGKHYRFSEVNYLALGQWAKSRRGLVMACEQDGADWLPFEPFRLTKSTKKKYSKEVMWTKRTEPANAAELAIDEVA